MNVSLFQIKNKTKQSQIHIHTRALNHWNNVIFYSYTVITIIIIIIIIRYYNILNLYYHLYGNRLATFLCIARCQVT